MTRALVPIGVFGLAAAGGFADTTDNRVARVAYLTALVASNTWSDLSCLIVGNLAHQRRIGDLGAGHLDGIANAIAQRPFGLAPIDNRALQDHLGRRAALLHGIANAAAHIDVETGWLMKVGSGLFDAEDCASNHHEIIEPACRELGSKRRSSIGSDAGPGCKLVARQAQTKHAISAQARSHGVDDFARKEQAVGAPFVAALIGETRQELADQAVLPGVDFDAVAIGLGGNLSSGTKPSDYGSDVVGFHPLRHFAAVDLGHPRWSPEFALAVGR